MAATHDGEGTSLLVPLGSSVTALAAEGELRGYKSTSGADAPSFIDLLARLKPCPSPRGFRRGNRKPEIRTDTEDFISTNQKGGLRRPFGLAEC